MEKSTYPGAIWIHRFGGREVGEREEGLKPGWVHQLQASPPGRHRLLTAGITPWRRWQHPGSFYISWLRGKQQSSGFSKPALSWNIVLRLHEAINQLSTNSALVPPLTLQHWWCRAALNIPHLLIFLGTCTYSKYRTKLPGFHDLQQPSPLMVNAEIKVFPCGCLNFFCCRKGLSLLRHACKLHFHLALKMVCTDLLYSGTIPFAVWRRTDSSGVLQTRAVSAGAVQEDVTGYHSIRLLQQYLKPWIIWNNFP